MNVQKVLIIDDDKNLCSNLEDILKDNGYEPFSASTCVEGLMLTRTIKPQVVLLDYKLPDCEGIALLSNIKEIDPDCYCIIITAYAALESAVSALEKGAYHYLQKPIRPAELLQILERIFLMIHLKEEKKKTEESLIESEERYRTLVNNLHVGVYRNTADPRGRFIQINPAMVEIFGYDSTEDFMNISPSVLYQDPEDRKSYIEKIRKQGFVKDEELKLKRKDGTHIWASLTATVQYDGNGNIKWIDGVVDEITDRKRIEEALRKSEEMFRSLVETTSDWIWEVDLKGFYTYSSPKVKDILGYEIEEIIGKTPFDFMPDEEAKRISDIFNKIIKTKKPFARLENINIHKDGREVVIESSGVPIFDKQGSLLGYRGIDRDISERKLSEKEIERRIQELEEFYEIAVGRELRMRQLKKEIERLKKELEIFKSK